MTQAIRQWRAIFSIYAQENLAYPAVTVIWILTDVVTAITMPLVFISAARGGMIQGFDASDFATYYLVMIAVTCFVTCHLMWEVALEIKEGQFSVALMRPMDYLAFSFCRSLAYRLTRPLLLLPIFLLLVAGYWRFLGGVELHLGLEFWLALLLGHLVSFTFVMAMAMLALFVQETTSIFELYYLPMLFLSGQLIPVPLLPEWVQQAGRFFPFYYTTAFPTELAMGRVASADVLPGLGAQMGWIAGALLVQRVLWRLGLRQYTGVGM